MNGPGLGSLDLAASSPSPRRGGWRGRAYVAASVALMATVATVVIRRLPGSPAQLVVPGDGIVVNNVKPVRLGLRVLDARGHALPDTGVRYRWAGGAPVAISPSGIATCARSGDATIRATLGSLSTSLVLRCRPVSAVRQQAEASLIIGEGPAPISFTAVDDAGRQVSPVRGEIRVLDSAVASMERASDGQWRLRGRSTGRTEVEVSIGDRTASVFAEVYHRAATPEGMPPGDQVAVGVGLNGGEMRQWRLSPSKEAYTIRLRSGGGEEPAPRLAVPDANCVAFGVQTLRCVALRGASVVAYYPARPGDRSREWRGDLLVSRDAYP